MQSGLSWYLRGEAKYPSLDRMSSAPKPHIQLTPRDCTLGAGVSGGRRIRRLTPHVMPRASDLALCRERDESPNALTSGQSNGAALHERSNGRLTSGAASLVSAYRPKHEVGGGYSFCRDLIEETMPASVSHGRELPKARGATGASEPNTPLRSVRRRKR
jgi:hypothetical protein